MYLGRNLRRGDNPICKDDVGETAAADLVLTVPGWSRGGVRCHHDLPKQSSRDPYLELTSPYTCGASPVGGVETMVKSSYADARGLLSSAYEYESNVNIIEERQKSDSSEQRRIIAVAHGFGSFLTFKWYVISSYRTGREVLPQPKTVSTADQNTSRMHIPCAAYLLLSSLAT